MGFFFKSSLIKIPLWFSIEKGELFFILMYHMSLYLNGVWPCGGSGRGLLIDLPGGK